MQIQLTLPKVSDWTKIYSPHDASVFVATDAPPKIGLPVRIDLVVGPNGPKVILRGKVVSRRVQKDGNLPKGCTVALGRDEREKIDYLTGFVRGGLLNLRETRRIPIRLQAKYSNQGNWVESYTRDINEEGVFVLADDPLPEGYAVQLVIQFPDPETSFEVDGVISHTVVIQDEDVPGMGIRFSFRDSAQKTTFSQALDKLEEAFVSGKLDDSFLL